ncbi:MAG: hypothetical protein HKL99_10495 [Burkholderiales bacterium]|nr:hypothetical protein [Burkholderiales bacterium]
MNAPEMSPAQRAAFAEQDREFAAFSAASPLQVAMNEIADIRRAADGKE